MLIKGHTSNDKVHKLQKYRLMCCLEDLKVVSIIRRKKNVNLGEKTFSSINMKVRLTADSLLAERRMESSYKSKKFKLGKEQQANPSWKCAGHW